jgi:glycosyltransferase involved in cell wall biosynthesis
MDIFTKPRLLRITTVPISLHLLITGQMRYMKSQGFEVLAVSADGPEIEKVKLTEGVDHVIIPFTRTISPFKDLVALIKLIRLVRSYRPDIVHTHTPKAGLLGMLAAWICRVPLRLHTVAGTPLMETKGLTRRILIFTEWLTYASATKVYPNSNLLKSYIENNISIRKNKLKVIGKGSSNGIDSQHFSRISEVLGKSSALRKELKLESTDFVWCFVGRLVGDKGIHELVDAFNEIQKQFPFQKLLLVGPFEDERDAIRPETKLLIEQNSSIIPVGFQSDVRPYLAMSQAFVFPSYREGFPNVVLQAGAMGLASIVSDINGCNEIVQDGVNGLIFPPKDSEKLKLAMIKLINDEKLRNQLAEMARDLAISDYDRNKIWEELLSEYKQPH